MALRALTTLETSLSHSWRGPPLELMEPPLGCFSPQMGTAGGELPPRARVTSLSTPSCHLLPTALAAWCCYTTVGLAPSVGRTASLLTEGEQVPHTEAMRTCMLEKPGLLMRAMKLAVCVLDQRVVCLLICLCGAALWACLALHLSAILRRPGTQAEPHSVRRTEVVLGELGERKHVPCCATVGRRAPDQNL
ncbi:hypothetical protein Q8A73_001978 [Channa argus]|nr:hypothetical protein Q8A73_001978 [Channa argus]